MVHTPRKYAVEDGDVGILSSLPLFWAPSCHKGRVCSKTGLFWGEDTECKGTFKLKERVMQIIA